MKIIRVFPRRTNAAPDDENVRINVSPSLFDEADFGKLDKMFAEELDKIYPEK